MALNTKGAAAGASAGSAFGPWGTAIGAGLGALTGGGSDEPPPGFRAPNWLKLHRGNSIQTNSPTYFTVESSEIPDPQNMASIARQLTAALNDPRQFDQDVLGTFAGTTVSVSAGGDSASLAQQLMEALMPARVGYVAPAGASNVNQVAQFTGDPGMIHAQQDAANRFAQVRDVATLVAVALFAFVAIFLLRKG